MNKPLPLSFAMQYVQNRWFAISPSGRVHDRTIDRRLLTVVDQVPSAPEPVKIEPEPPLVRRNQSGGLG